MKRTKLVSILILAVATASLPIAALVVVRGSSGLQSRPPWVESEPAHPGADHLRPVSSEGPPGERAPAVASSSPHGSGAENLPSSPRDEAELRELVAWLRGLPREELLRLSNADFDFEDSPLVLMLRDLEGDWVVSGLGSLAISEIDPLVKAVLVTGLFGGVDRDRFSGPRYIEAIQEVLPQLAAAESDPFAVAADVVAAAYFSSFGQGADYAALLLPHLEGSDNAALLVQGYFYLGQFPGTSEALVHAMTDHASPEGRFGALEGIRHAGLSDRIPAQEVARLGVLALAQEDSARNRILLVELLGSVGGEDGLRALQGMVESGAPGLLGPAASMIAVRMDPERAQETIERALSKDTLSPEDRGSLYLALGAVPGERGGELLLGAARDESLPDDERLLALRGLWNRPPDADLQRELVDIVESDAPGSMRAESLRMLALDGKEGTGLDARRIAVDDDDPAVRSEAVMLSALEPSADSRAWLEERLLNDRSPEVKAAALGAMVVQAHYTGNGGAVLDHLARARKHTDDPDVIALIERGETMVAEGDPRRLELGLRKDAELYRQIAPLTTGPARRSMERQAEYYRRMVESLGALSTAR